MKTSPALQASRLKHHARRKRINALALTLSLAAMAFGLFWLIWILVETVHGIRTVKSLALEPQQRLPQSPACRRNSNSSWCRAASRGRGFP